MSTLYKITCFIQHEPKTLFPLLNPLGFIRSRENTLVWRNGQHCFTIAPFSSKGRESQGYRVYFNGSPEAGQYLFEQTIGRYSPRIRGVEYQTSLGKTQHEMVNIADRLFKRGCMYGVYETNNRIGIIVLPNGDIVIQLRNIPIKVHKLTDYMREIEQILDKIRPDTFDLFSYLEEETGVVV